MTRSLKYVTYFPLYCTHMTLPSARAMLTHRSLVSFYCQSAFQASCAVLQQHLLFFFNIFMPWPVEGSSGAYSILL